MNNIGNSLYNYGQRYSQNTIKNGRNFDNFIRQVNQDSYDRNQREIAKGTKLFLNFLQKAKLNAFLNSINIRQNPNIQPRPIRSVVDIVDLTLDGNSHTTLESSKNTQNGKLISKKHKVPVFKYKLNRSLNKKQIEYLDNKSQKLLSELNEEVPQIIISGRERKHIISEKELKALINIAFCKKFGLESNNTKELERKIIDFEKIRDAKRINRNTAKNYFIVIDALINKNIGRDYIIKNYNYICEQKLNKMNYIIVNDLKELDKLKKYNM